MISKTAMHTLLAMSHLAALREGECAGAAAIARKINAPANYLGKLLQGLAREDLVISQKGHGGGFRLARRPECISLFDVLEPVEHVSRWHECFMGGGSCDPENPCALHDRWKRIRAAYLDFLCNVTLQDVVEKPEVLRKVG